MAKKLDFRETDVIHLFNDAFKYVLTLSETATKKPKPTPEEHHQKQTK